MPALESLGNPFTLGATGVETSARTDRFASAAGLTGPGNRTWRSPNGFLLDRAGYMGELTLLSDDVVRINPFVAILDGGLSTAQGPYVVPNLVARDLDVPAKDATQTRRALLVVYVKDSLESGVASSPATDGAWVELLSGALAPANPVTPATPTTGLAAGHLTIPSAASGQPVTLTPYNPRTAALGGILPVTIPSTLVDPSFIGQARHHPDYGLQIADVTEVGGDILWDGPAVRNLPKMGAAGPTGATGTGTGGFSNVLLQTDLLMHGFERISATEFSALWPGWYELKGMVTWEGNAAGRRIPAVQLNGSIIASSQNIVVSSGASPSQRPSSPVFAYLTPADTIGLMAYQDTGGNLDTTALGSRLWANYLGY